jgi:hypothetical protein
MCGGVRVFLTKNCSGFRSSPFIRSSEVTASEVKRLEEEAEHIENFVADLNITEIGFFNEP